VDGFERFVDVARFMVPAAITTLMVALIAFPGALTVATIVTVPRIHRIPVISWLADQYVDFVRTTPLLLHLFFVYFALPFVGIRVEPITAGVLTLSLHVGAYQSEVLKAAYHAVPQGLVEAANVLGMSRLVRLRRVMLPLALRVALPGLANSMIEILMDTVILSVVGVVEIFFSRTLYFYQFFAGRIESLIVVCLFFVIIGVPASRLVRRMERRLTIPGSIDQPVRIL
jgi:His/Glu/Gln/Arg/opine family amino acid ABC transporter permease subunit